MLHRFFAISIFLACAGAPSAASAFSAPEGFVDDPYNGGGGGRWFSGSPAEGFGCSVCHVQAAAQRHFPLNVSGLPATYLPGAQYQVTINWPAFAQRWRELRPDPLVPLPPLAPKPGAGLITELVAESGRASGKVTVNLVGASPSELCEMNRPNLLPRLGVRMYQVRADVPPLLVEPDADGALSCEARRLGQRCLIALTACGAQQVRFTWTAPPTWEGPIWFSAGFVATEAESGTPELDSTAELALPVLQTGTASATYKDVLRRGCGLGSPHGRGSFAACGGAVWLSALLVHRRRRRAGERS